MIRIWVGVLATALPLLAQASVIGRSVDAKQLVATEDLAQRQVMVDWDALVAKPVRAGALVVEHLVAVDIDSRRDGVWTEQGGVQRWTLTLTVPGARTLSARVAFSPIPGAVLHLGPEVITRATGGYRSAPVSGEELTLVMTAPADAGMPLVKLNSIGVGPPRVSSKDGDIEDEFVPYDCHASESNALAARASLMVWVPDDAGTYTKGCSGTLINNQMGVDGAPRPYVMLAEHCQAEGDDGYPNPPNPAPDLTELRTFWQYEDPCGTPAENGEDSLWDAITMTGATHVGEWVYNGTVRVGDFWLIELDHWPPEAAKAYLSGFDASQVPLDPEFPVGIVEPDIDYVFGIHHGGLRSKQYVYSEHVTYGEPANSAEAVGSFSVTTVGEGTIGDTSGGASGSGLFAPNQLLLGVDYVGGDDGTSYGSLGSLWTKYDVGEYLVLSPEDDASRIMAGQEAPLPLPPPEVSLSFGDVTITTGESVNLSWSAEGADSCVASGSWAGEQSLVGDAILTPPAPGQYVYVLTCENVDASTSASVTVTVQPPPASGGGALGSQLLLMLAGMAGAAALRGRRRTTGVGSDW